MWPDLLEEILERDREAWNAVRSVVPLSLESDVLAVGLASQSDLAAFKSVGAGPLREAILSAVGVRVKYVPKRLPEGHAAGPQNAPRETQTGSAADAEEPHRAGQSSGPVNQTSQSTRANSDDPEQRAAARLSALGPALAAPAWADPQPDSVSSIAEVLETSSTPDPEITAAHKNPQPTVDSSEEPSAEQATSEQTSAEAPDAYVEPSDDLYGDGDPYAEGDPCAESSAGIAQDTSAQSQSQMQEQTYSAPEGATSSQESADPEPPKRSK
ncbi:hypothetical protein G7066_03470 [Leucobacter coleopterorum]|uniref:DNA polymerase-3 subunit gamma/tau n=1 Tax=Leucobacter coleopterorum TaxID=2714933 RepID=A0ABX6JYU7_9MICO|nr:hypothetical protein G7066_03470 [Leucobacter coleopterorum]